MNFKVLFERFKYDIFSFLVFFIVIFSVGMLSYEEGFYSGMSSLCVNGTLVKSSLDDKVFCSLKSLEELNPQTAVFSSNFTLNVSGGGLLV